MAVRIPLLEQGPKFSAEEAKQLRKRFLEDAKFKMDYYRVRNAWLLRKITVEQAVKFCKEALQESLERAKKETDS